MPNEITSMLLVISAGSIAIQAALTDAELETENASIDLDIEAS
jgi:hypothetical protein